jgi:hypothetical protein
MHENFINTPLAKVEIAASPALHLLNKIDAVPLLIYKGGVYTVGGH